MSLNELATIPGRRKSSFSSSQRPDLLGSPCYPMGSLSPGVKRPGIGAHYSPPFSVEVENCKEKPPLPHTS